MGVPLNRMAGVRTSCPCSADGLRAAVSCRRGTGGARTQARSSAQDAAGDHQAAVTTKRLKLLITMQS